MSPILPSKSVREDLPPGTVLENVMTLLRRALDLLDGDGAPPELAACVQDALDKVAAFADARD